MYTRCQPQGRFGVGKIKTMPMYNARLLAHWNRIFSDSLPPNKSSQTYSIKKIS
jgi:hypothetical protein